MVIVYAYVWIALHLFMNVTAENILTLPMKWLNFGVESL